VARLSCFHAAQTAGEATAVFSALNAARKSSKKAAACKNNGNKEKHCCRFAAVSWAREGFLHLHGSFNSLACRQHWK
jgi:hypothetical protein